VASFDEFIAKLEEEYPDPSLAGTAIEPFIRDALFASPSHQFEEAWLWDDWPGRDGPEHGIDVVAKDTDGQLWGIQSKYSTDPQKNLTWGSDKISHWAGSVAGPKWDFGLLVSNCVGIDEHVEREVLQNPKLKLLLGDDLHDLRVDWPSELNEPTRQKTHYDPLPHQVQAIQAITDGFDQGAERLQVHMACGTGKTFTALWAYQYLQPDLALVLVPSLSLMTQTIREWTANTSVPFRFLSVCSDPKVAVEHLSSEEKQLHLGDLTVMDSPATTSLESIKEFLEKSGSKVIFSTYQSSPLIAEATTGETPFGLVVCDEAHRTATDRESIFATVLDDRKIAATRRLFMTATPRVFVQSSSGDETTYSMDNEEIFGEVAFQLGFGDAVDLGLLADFEVAVIAIDDPKVRALVDSGDALELEGIDKKIQSPSLLALEATLLALEQYGISRMISFHSRVNRAQEFASSLSAYSDWRKSDAKPEGLNISGFMNAPTRKNRLQWLKNASIHPKVLTNARCLNEGVDVPALDGILFADPKKSQLDIVQAVGRVMRRDPDNPDKVGRIIVPVVVPKANETDADNVFEDSSFKPVWDVVRALKAHDFRLEDQLRRRRGKGSIGSELEPEEDSGGFGDSLPIRTIGIDDIEHLELAIVNKSTSSFWWWLGGPFAQHYERTGGVWPASGWIEEFEGAEVKLGTWCATQRGLQKSGNMPDDRFVALEAAGFEWSTRNVRRTIDGDEEFLFALELFKEERGHPWPSHGTVVEGVDLALEVKRMWGLWRSAPGQPKYTPEQVQDAQARVYERWNNIRSTFPEYPEIIPPPNHLQKASRIAELAIEIRSMSVPIRERELEDKDFADWCDEVRTYVSNSFADQVPHAAITLLTDTQGWEEERFREWEKHQKDDAKRTERLKVRASFPICSFLSQIEPTLFDHLVIEADHTIIQHRFPVEKELETLEQVGERLSLTRERVRQREKQIRQNIEGFPFTFNETELLNLPPVLPRSFLGDLREKIELVDCNDLEPKEFVSTGRSSALVSRITDVLRWLEIPAGMFPKQLLLKHAEPPTFWTGKRNRSSNKQQRTNDLKTWDNAVAELVFKGTALAKMPDGVPLRYPVEMLGLRERTRNCLRFAGIHTLGKLFETPDSKLMQIDNFGELSLEDVNSLRSQITSGDLVLTGTDFDPDVKRLDLSPQLDALWEKGIRSLDDLKLPATLDHTLRRGGINSLEGLLDASDNELLRMKNFGQKSLDQLHQIYRPLIIEALEDEAVYQPLNETSFVWQLGSTVRVNNVLGKLHISTVGQLLQLNVEELMKQTAFGETSLDDLNQRLRSHGFPELKRTSHSSSEATDEVIEPLPSPPVEPLRHDIALRRVPNDLPFSAAINRCLHKNSLATLEAVAAATDQYLLALKDFRPTWLVQVRKVTHPDEIVSEETHIVRLDLPPHVLSALKGLLVSGINTVGKLSKASTEDLLEIKFMGWSALNTLDSKLESVGLKRVDTSIGKEPAAPSSPEDEHYSRPSKSEEPPPDEVNRRLETLEGADSDNGREGSPLDVTAKRATDPMDDTATRQEIRDRSTEPQQGRESISEMSSNDPMLQFSNRIRHCLIANGFDTFARVKEAPDERLLGLRAFAPSYLSEIRELTHPKQQLHPAMHIARLPLDSHARQGFRALIEAKVTTIEELCNLSNEAVLDIKGIGSVVLNVIDEVLESQGITRNKVRLAMTVPAGTIPGSPAEKIRLPFSWNICNCLVAGGLTDLPSVSAASDHHLLDMEDFKPAFLREIRDVTHPGQSITPDMHLGRLPLSHALGRKLPNFIEQGITTVGDLCEASFATLLSVVGVGPVSIAAIDSVIESVGLKREGSETQTSTLLSELQDLVALHESAHLTDEEFQAAKAKLLGL
jgi:superfamily II DNA or RNA helicase/DNA-directed RNA polymerase alpha subunit